MQGKPEAFFLPRSPAQWEARRLYAACDVLFFLGAAGVGKTHAAVGLALAEVLAGKRRKLYFSRPLVACGESLGYHKGTLEQKLAPWMGALADVLGNLTFAKLTALQAAGKLEYLPLAYLRGRTVADSVLILDEGQNTTLPQVKMLLTRLGEGGKIVLTGDPDQSDLPRPVLSAVAESLEGLPGVGVVRFSGEYTVRHPLIPEMLKRLGGLV